MDYLVFKTEVKKRIREFLPESMKDFEVKFMDVEKVNESLDGFTLMPKGGHIGPTGYINTMWVGFQENNNFELTLTEYLAYMAKAYENQPKYGDNIMNVFKKENVVFQLINTMANIEYLKDKPNRPFNDLSIIYRILLDDNDDCIASIMVTNQIMHLMEVTEDELFRLAAVNTRQRMGIKLGTMESFFFGIEGEPDDPKESMWILSNKFKHYGAAAMLYEDTLHDLAGKMETDLYILPSSIHECLIVSTHLMDPEQLVEMVQEVNRDEVDVSERLSNNVYHYDKNLRKVTLATDVPTGIKEN